MWNNAESIRRLAKERKYKTITAVTNPKVKQKPRKTFGRPKQKPSHTNVKICSMCAQHMCVDMFYSMIAHGIWLCYRL